MIYITALLIFFARILDVSIGTIKLIFISKGYRKLATILAMFEITIWLIAIRQIMLQLSSPWAFAGYTLGFTAGTYIGMIIEEKISIGKVVIRIITKKDASGLIKTLNKEKYRTTEIQAKGEVNVIISVIERKNIQKVADIIKKFNPAAFFSIEDVKFVSDNTPIPKSNFRFISRKGK